VGWERFYKTTGGGLELALYPAAKILWLKEHEPKLYTKTYKFIGTKDLIVHWLTGRISTDFSDASNTGLFDIQSRRWASDLIRALGIEEEKLPEDVLPSTTIVGEVCAEASHETGLAQGIPVVLGGGDVPCAAVGAGVVTENSIYNNIGSASWVAVATRKPIFDLKMRPFTLCHLVPNMYVTQLATYSAGVVYSWFRDQICQTEASRAEELGSSPFRAVLEGITVNICLLCRALEQQIGTEFSEIRMIGGGAKSSLWRSIAASILNKDVLSLSAQQEANSLGAAMTACVGIGIFDQFDDAAREFIRVDGDVLSLSAQQEANSLGAAMTACVGIGIFDQFDDAAREFIRVNGTSSPDEKSTKDTKVKQDASTTATAYAKGGDR
jgi:xylulokinase